MAFHEVRLPEQISYGSRGGPGYNTQIFTLDGGYEVRSQRWARARRQYDLRYGVLRYRSISDQESTLQLLYEFYLARSGSLNGFRMKDHMDFTSAADGVATPATDDQLIGIGDGSETEFQLVKAYESGSQRIVRDIRKPVMGTVVVEVDGTPLADSAFSVNFTTGVVTLDTAPGSGEDVKAGFEFDVPVRFGEGVDQRLLLSLDAFESGSAQVEVVELLEDYVTAQDFFYGGSKDVWMPTSITMDMTSRVWNLSTGSSGKYARLPDPTLLPPGGPYFFITVEAGTPSIELQAPDGTALVTIAGGEGVTVYLAQDASLNKLWYVL